MKIASAILIAPLTSAIALPSADNDLNNALGGATGAAVGGAVGGQTSSVIGGIIRVAL